jgi:hypothetical protein
MGMDIIDEGQIDQAHAGRSHQRGVSLAPILRDGVFNPKMAPALRQFACACCRAVQDRLGEHSIRALEVIERFAHGRASFEELVRARDAAKLAVRRARRHVPRDAHVVAASEAVCHAGRNQAFEALLLTSEAACRAGLTIRSQAKLLTSIWQDFERAAENGTAGL